MQINSQNYRKIVIKIGSSLIVENNQIRLDWLENFANNIQKVLANNDCQIIIVSSGAVALGRINLNLVGKKISIPQKQACAGIGQIDLVSLYKNSFQKAGFKVAQILLTSTDCNSRKGYLNCKNTIETLLENSVIPIINENDSIAVDEIKIGDNDRLSARVAQMIGADLMILFSDIDGLYDSNPKINPNAKFIEKIDKITPDIEKMAQGVLSSKSAPSVGTGGMITKIMAAKMACGSSCDTIITSGVENDALIKLMLGKKRFTIFLNNKELNKKSKHNSVARKTWLAGLVNANGAIIINEDAVKALKSQKASLLAVGAVDIIGEFSKGDTIFIRDEAFNHIASGVVNHGSDIIKKILKKNSQEIKKILGSKAKPELVHLDNFVLIN